MGNNILEKEAADFFRYSYFGITSKDKEEDIIIKCAQKAYLDLCRTLTFKESLDEKKNEEQRHKFRGEICKIIKKEIDILLTSNKTNFDKEHKKACNAIKAAVKKYKILNTFSDGQAQKWLNMTLKYMWLLGIREDKFKNIKSVMHIPVDSIILEAIWHEELEESNNSQIDKDAAKNLFVKLPCENEKRIGKYSNDKVDSWSKWTYTQYEQFQTTLRTWCANRSNNQSPIEWENAKWIEYAAKRK